MGHIEIIERLCQMLDVASDIIKEQQELLEMNGISTESGRLEEMRTSLLEDIEKYT